jgi:arylsulfatase A-like enzyme
LEYDPVPEFRDRFLNKVDDDRITSIDQNAWRYIAGKTELTTEDFEILRGLYKAEIAYVDSKIGELYGVLERTGLLENTCIVVVGDHGENIGEHGLMDHQYCLYETLLNVPLIIRYPDGNGGEIVESPVETRDIFPTVLDVADIKLPASNAISDNSLRTSPAREYVISEYRVPQPSMESLEAQVGRLSREVLKYDRALRSVRRREWKLIEGSDGSIELYDLESDPLEYIDCSSEHPQKIELLSSIFDEECVPLSKDPNINAEMSEVSRRQLEDLGYI